MSLWNNKVYNPLASSTFHSHKRDKYIHVYHAYIFKKAWELESEGIIVFRLWA